MSEVAIILSDLYFAAGGHGSDERAAAVPQAALPSLARVARYGRVSALDGGWRSWLAGWLGRADLAAACTATPAAVAAAAAPAAVRASAAGTVWLATPLYLVAGLTSVHLDHRGLLRLDARTQQDLVRDFDATFTARGFSLHRLPGGGLLATGPVFAQLPSTLDPARLIGGGIGGSTVHGAGAAPLLSIAAELEMWLHAHPLNQARLNRREAPLTTLWLWGGGAPLEAPATPAAAAARPEPTRMTVFGADPVAAGLCVLSGARLREPATGAQELLASASERTAAVIELFGTERGQSATLLELLQQLDENLLAPLVRALQDGVVRQLTLIANDRCSVLGPRDGLRLWRRPRAPLAVLQ